MFCPAVSMRSAPHGTGQAGDYNVGLDKSSGARRIDAAIKAVIDIDHDALRGSRTFQPRFPYQLVPEISPNSSTLSGVVPLKPPLQVAPSPSNQSAVGSGGGYPGNQSVGVNSNTNYIFQQNPNPRLTPVDGSMGSGSLNLSETSRAGGSSGGGGGVGSFADRSGGENVIEYGKETPVDWSNGTGGGGGKGRGGGSGGRQPRSVQGGGRGGDATTAVSRGGGGAGDRSRPVVNSDMDTLVVGEDGKRLDNSGQEAFAPLTWDTQTLWDDDGGLATHPVEHDGDGGGGDGVALTPAGYDEPLELPDGCHHISLSRFLEVMAGPGLRVRKHHRAGKGSSGLRVLRYSEDDDSLTWNSHKLLGTAKHVLPMSDVQGVSMLPGNRVILRCVGGKDSYAMFEAANDDAAAVLLVGLERLRERTAALII